MQPITQGLVEYLKRFEKFEPNLYRCPAGLPTIGYGHVLHQGETFTTVTEAEAEELLKSDIIIAKHRNGPVGDFELLFQSNITKFKNPIKTDIF